MASYNFLYVDSHEFEEICSEILGIYLGIRMRVFPEGRDRGIDIKRASGEEDIIGQCKRIQKVTTIFKGEFNKVKKIKSCKRYYLFLACGITARQRTDIFNLFSSYMKDENDIFDAGDLNLLLEKDEYQEVIKKHFKLWISSEKLFELFTNKIGNFDSNALVNSIREHRKFYVDTPDFYKAFDSLMSEHIVLITGHPGVGKSTISEMAVLSFIEKFNTARIVYSASSDLSQIKNSVSSNETNKELIYIDDFLGDYYLDLRTNNISSIYQFINAIRGRENKYLIINSRIVILNDACSRSVKFQNSIDKIENCMVEIKNLTSYQKGKILYNHLYFSDIGDDLKQEIIDDKRYWQLINHPNYNPRLIEYISNPRNYERGHIKSYYDFVIDSLNKAGKIWKEAIESNLDEVDRWFLITMKSFGQDYVKYDVQKAAFDHVVRGKRNLDPTIDNFEGCVQRLNGSFVYLSGSNKDRYFSFLNPSIKESLACELPRKSKDFVALEQFIYSNKSFLRSEKFKNLCIEGTADGLVLNSVDINEVYLLFFSTFPTNNADLGRRYIDAICYSISGKRRIFDAKVDEIYKKVITREYLDFYGINALKKENIHKIIANIFEACHVSDAIELLGRFDKQTICDNINDCCLTERLASDELSNLNLTKIVDSYIVECEDGQEFDEYGARNEISNVIIDAISDSIYLEELNVNYGFELDPLEVSDLVDGLDLDEEIADYYADLTADIEMERYKEERAFVVDDVDVMFSHLLDEKE